MPIFHRPSSQWPCLPFRFFAGFATRLAVLVLSFAFFTTPGHALPEDEARINNRAGVLLAQRGDLQRSLQAFERAVKADPADETARTNLATAYNNMGVFLCREGKYPDALFEFEKARAQKPEDLQVRLNLLSALVSMRDAERVDREARSIIALRPTDPKTLLKVAIAFQRIEDAESSRNLLERIISTDPDNTEALSALGRLYYQQGNLSEARYYLERSHEKNPPAKASRDLLKRINREAGVETRFDRESSVHFVLTCEDRLNEEWIKDLLDVFEEAYTKIGDVLGYYPNQKVQVIVYSPRDFQRVNDSPAWAGGLYDGKIRLPVPPRTVHAEQLRGAVFHEYCHHVIHVLADGRCPTWLNEGLAQYFEGLSVSAAHKILQRHGPAGLPTMKALQGSFAQLRNRADAEVHYAASLWLVQHLLDEKGVSAIQGVLTSLAQRQTLEDAIAAGLGFSGEALESKLRESLEMN